MENKKKYPTGTKEKSGRRYAGFDDPADGKERLSRILGVTRTKAGVSQERMALELEVARKTVQNWEKGVTAPSFDQVTAWFQVLGISPLPYLFQYLYPELEGISGADSDERIRDSLEMLIENIPSEGARQLLYLFYGDHGSSPRAILNLMTAHLQTPMKDRVTQAGVIIKNYDIAKKKGTIVGPTHIQPDMTLLHHALEEGEAAVLRDEEVYVLSALGKEK